MVVSLRRLCSPRSDATGGEIGARSRVPAWNGDCIFDGMTSIVELIRTVPRAGAP